MKVAFDAQLLFEKQKTGIGKTVENILNNLDATSTQHEFILDYFSMRGSKEKQQIINPYKRLGYKVQKCNWFHNYIYRKIWRLLPIPYSFFFHDKVDIVQYFNYDLPPLIHGKGVTFVYDMVYKAYPETMNQKTYEMLDKNLVLSCNRADHIITISDFSKREIVKYMHLNENQVSVMPCGVDLETYHNHYTSIEIQAVIDKYSIDNSYILYLGTLEPRKNIERLIEAYNIVHSRQKDVPQLVISGKKGWNYKTIYDKVIEYGIEKKVKFTGYIEDYEVPLLLNGAKCFVFPSLYEGFGLPPLEAMACGTPVIVSNCSAIPEVVGDAGIYINPTNSNDIADKLEELLLDESLQAKLSSIGILQAEKYTWKSSADTLLGIYRKIMEA